MSVLCVGDIPPIFRERLALSFPGEVRHETRLPAAIDAAFVFYAESASEREDLARLAEEECAVGYWAPVVGHDQLVSIVLSFDIDVVLHGEPPGAPAMEYAIRRLQRRLSQASGAPAGRGTLRLGDLFTVPDGDPEQRHRRYQRSAGLALLSASTQDMARAMRFTIKAMNRQPVPKMPWRAGGRSALTAKKVLPGGAVPTLDDLFQLGPSGDAKQRLGFGQARMRREAYPKTGMALIRGQSGTGKSLVADLMHQAFQQSPQWRAHNAVPSSAEAGPESRDVASMPFVRINCGAMTAENFDHTLIGTAAEQFSGIGNAVVGLLPRADYGVAFFDEIGDMDPTAQSRLKPILDDLEVTPFGMEPYYLHLRVIAATNVDLESSGFQHDLLQRFSYSITVPPLSERAEELPRLIDYAAQNPMINITPAGGLDVTHIDQAAMRELQAHDWSHGNFRELRRVVESAVFQAMSDRRRAVSAQDVRDSFLAKPIAPRERRRVQVAREISDPGEIPVLSAEDLEKAAIVHDVPILVSPDGNQWVRAAGVTYSYRSDDV